MRQPSIALSQQALQQAVREYILGIYQWMVGGLLITAGVALLVGSSAEIVMFFARSPLLLLFVLLAEIGLVVWLSARIEKMSLASARAAFVLYAALNGVTLSLILSLFTEASVATAFFIAAGMYGVMAVYGYTTKRDLTALGSFAFMGLIGVLLAMVVNFFLQSAAIDFAISVIGVLVFTILTAVDMQKLRKQYIPGEEATTEGKKRAILGALMLYLDFINLFLFLLRLLGERR